MNITNGQLKLQDKKYCLYINSMHYTRDSNHRQKQRKKQTTIKQQRNKERRVWVFVSIHMYIYIRIHLHTYAYVHIYSHSYREEYIMHLYTHTHILMHTYMYADERCSVYVWVGVMWWHDNEQAALLYKWCLSFIFH